MNWKLPLIASAMLTALGLASCGGLSKSNNETISNPTVDQMKALEAQWGVKPGAPATPAGRTSAPMNVPSGGAPATFAPAPSAPTVPMTSAPAPLQFEAAPPAPAAPPSAPPSIPPSLR